MVKISYYLQTFFDAIYTRLFDPRNVDEDSVRKSLMYGITGIGIIFLGILGSIAVIQGGLVLATLDFTVAILLVGLLFLLRYSGYLQFCIYFGVILMFFLFFYLFLSGGITGTAFLWTYTYPLFTFFLLGSRKGFIFSSVFFLSCLTVLLVDLNSTKINLYDLNLALRFIPSFIVVILFSLLYEKYRENSHKALLEAKNSLEKKVQERTKELVKEVSIRKKKEQELRSSEARYRILYENSGDGISIINQSGYYSSANQRFCKQVGYTEEELRFKRPEDIYFNGSTLELLKAVFTSGSAEFETSQVSRCGNHVPVEIRAQRIIFDNEEAILCSCRGISDRKNREEENKILQEKLHRASKMEAIGLMAGGIAHDLNNILAGVTGYPELMLLKLPPDSELRKPITATLQSGRRAAAVVAELLTMARGVASTKEPHDCNLLIDKFLATPEANKIVTDYPEVTIVKRFGTNTGRLLCSPIHFQKCIMNLLLNAVEVVGDKRDGKVEITTDQQYLAPEVLNRLHLDSGEYVIIGIRDNGPGILKQDIDHIFEPFYSRKILARSGTGLGLTVVWNVVQEHNGAISVDSCEQGTLFNLYFPATDEAEIEHLDELIRWQQSSRHVLVVDDEPQLRNVASEMLAAFGYTVKTVASGEEAVACLKREKFDLVLLDMMMEPGMNGRQTYEEIVQFKPKQKALIASGFSEDGEVQRALALGASGFIRKPYSLNELWSAVQKSMDSCKNS